MQVNCKTTAYRHVEHVSCRKDEALCTYLQRESKNRISQCKEKLILLI